MHESKLASKIQAALACAAIAAGLWACSASPPESVSSDESLADEAVNPHAPTSSQSPYRQISQEEAMDMLETESDYILLDVRTPEEFSSSHIPGAVNVPVEDIGDEPPQALPDKQQLIMVYCRRGNRSKTAAQKLYDMGYSNVVEFGGINTWPGDVTSSE